MDWGERCSWSTFARVSPAEGMKDMQEDEQRASVNHGSLDPSAAAAVSSRPASEPAASPTLADRAHGLWDHLDLSWKLSIWLLITLRVGLGLAAILSIHLTPISQTGGELVNLVMPGTDFWTQTLSTWQRYDALWYQQIAQHGYQAGTGTGAFYPLYPLLSRIVSFFTGGHIVVAELIVSSVAFIIAMWLLYRVVQFDCNARVAQLTVLLTAFFPVSFFLIAPYTESLYLALTLATFYFARRSRPWAAGAAGFAAALTHDPGVFLAFPLLYEYLRRKGAAWWRPHITLLSTGLPILGPVVVAVYLRFIVGETRSIFQLNAAYPWGYHQVAPWQSLADSWSHIVATGDSIEVLNFVALIGFTLLSIWAARRLRLSYVLYVWPYLALLFTREMLLTPLMSDARLVLVLFPCFIVIAIWLAQRSWVAAGCLVVGGFLQVSLFEYWVHFGFVG